MSRRRFYPREVRREFWEQVRRGLTVAEAAQAVGASRFSGMDWYRDRGGGDARAFSAGDKAAAVDLRAA